MKDWYEKAADWYSKKQYQELEKVYEFDETISKNDKKLTAKRYNKSDLIKITLIIVSTYTLILKNLIVLL